ncbi:hypothetical protein ACQKNB_18585 [Lysinibacillus xylanilyticus]|uniref:hypothetical protein n=1 Tax=Lysinibacillus xylanilyticus TaxID=582475 RepID=UPI003D0886B1
MNWFVDLNISDKITIISSSVTAIISIASVWIALKALQTTKNSIVEANRPYVVIAIETIDIGFYAKYLVVKNYGNTGAYIKSIKSNHDFSDKYFSNFLKDFSDKFIAPGQSFITYLDIQQNESHMQFEISYTDSNKEYKETFKLDTSLYKHHVHQTVNKSNLGDLENTLNNIFHAQSKTRL